MTGVTAPAGAGPADSAAAGAQPGLALRSSEFRRGREDSWRDLETLVAVIEKRGVRALSADDLQRLPLLYRTALSSLSVARSIALDRNLLLYLENLALRGYLAVYGPRVSLLRGAGDFLVRGFPAAVVAARWHVLIAVLCMAVGSIAGFALTIGDESWFSSLVPTGLSGGRGPASSHADLHDHEIFAPWPGVVESFAVMANFLFTHNTVVGILTFSLGLAAGVPTILLLLYQGLILGAFLALHANRELTVDFLGWVAIHGVTEIGAIILCGAAGLVIADKLLFPGRHARVESVAIHGRMAAQIAVGAVLMFFIAAILEGGFRQLIQSTPWRLAIGAATGIGWLTYVTLCARRRPS
jgi:uncharacterized membrane protein SpoIIM required for sporulation